MGELADLALRHSRPARMTPTSIPQLVIYRSETPSAPVPAVHRPSLCFVAQGTKEMTLGGKVFRYTAGEYLVSTVDLPTTGEIVEGSARRPYLCFALTIDPGVVHDVLRDANQSLVDRARRSRTQRIAKAIEQLKNGFAASLTIDELARLAGMSASSLHEHFKKVTTLSPLQYQKQLRLQEARRLLVAEGTSAAEVGFRVGYQSASQFSREYARFFGRPPRADVREILERRAGGPGISRGEPLLQS